MTNDFIAETRELLEDRKQEIDRHLTFAKTLIDTKARKLAKLENRELVEIKEYEIDRGLVKTMSATGYLLIYNLIESVMTSAVDAVHRQLKADELQFSQLSEKLKSVCLGNFKSGFSSYVSDEHSALTMNELLVWLGYRKNKHWNGNVDANGIKDKAAKYGIEIKYRDEDYSDIKSNFFDIRKKRNDLAHGELSFEQCGQDTPIDLLLIYAEQAYKYLSAVVDGFEIYLIEKKYRAAC
ncbi:hypothetical protein EZI54_21180 [Marinobacter halodurans]|uniref:MAE-28990/MAE-18760-like HEPN domain-containing protein n=1 Tax=Marinobacter halodurans TaxID=2528979 RepID=A0ABY1ZIB1_9GAMM|nr:MAE_28990/MAE_18760 family HEPN-like nuclease [Marinobacter halodurans]TBW48511.1 hypothetical protein EZI54_21180 [Marinobacter halodurans]